jgi:pimeloyl-ACP methyl ester carboxylesterase
MTTTNFEPISKTFNSQGLKLHYLDWGNEGAPLLLLLHGTRDHARSWDWVARELRHDWHIVALDARGHGDSAWSPDGAYLTPYHLLDLVDFIEVLGQEQITIVAHSFGGNATSRYAGLYPQRVRKLVLVDAMGPTPEVVARWDELGPAKRTTEWLDKQLAVAKQTPRRLATLEEGVTRMAAANKHLSEEQARHLATHGVRQYADGYGWKYDPRTGTFLPEDFAVDLADYWTKITAPTLLCWGNESWTSNPVTDGRAVHFRDHQHATFEKAGHWLHHDQLDLFVAALRAFL